MRPLYEAKMIHHYDHRPRHLRRPDRGSGQPGHPAAAHPPSSTPIPTLLPHSRYWVADEEVEARLLDSDKPPERRRPWPAAGSSAGATSLSQLRRSAP
jgi:hypothetical protein